MQVCKAKLTNWRFFVGVFASFTVGAFAFEFPVILFAIAGREPATNEIVLCWACRQFARTQLAASFVVIPAAIPVASTRQFFVETANLIGVELVST